jgi:hypothetical protein
MVEELLFTLFRAAIETAARDRKSEAGGAAMPTAFFF